MVLNVKDCFCENDPTKKDGINSSNLIGLDLQSFFISSSICKAAVPTYASTTHQGLPWRRHSRLRQLLTRKSVVVDLCTAVTQPLLQPALRKSVSMHIYWLSVCESLNWNSPPSHTKSKVHSPQFDITTSPLSFLSTPHQHHHTKQSD